MDPLSALSVAAAVLQFVDFGLKVVGAGVEISKSLSGATDENFDIKFLTEHTQQLTARFIDPLSGNVVVKAGVLGAAADPSDVRRLRELGERSRDVAKELVELLRKVKGGSSVKGWAVVGPAVRSVWSEAKVASLRDRLQNIKDQISLQLLCMICDGQSTASTLMEDFVQRSKTMQMQQNLALNQFMDDIKIQIAKQDSRLLDIVDSLNAIRQKESVSRSDNPRLVELKGDVRSELVGAQTRRDSFKRVSSGSPAGKGLEDNYKSLFDLTVVERGQIIGSASGQMLKFVDGLEDEAKQLRILESLYYSELGLRQSEVKQAWPSTYTWIFTTESSPFATWLKKSGGTFWISGKPGAGKSTLMKFLAEQAWTKRLLKEWCGPRRLLLGTHFFWSTGQSMQKSLQGLLQSLLFQVLSHSPELIKQVCPERWNEDGSLNTLLMRWSVVDMHEKVIEALDLQGQSTSVCFFLDGLDEYAEDQYLLVAEKIKLYASKPNVKICVSSRPHNVFENSFGAVEDRRLILQDLTVPDMDLFIQGKLVDDTRFRKLRATDERAQMFVKEIRQRAAGVFLWVYVVIEQLFSGINEGDDMMMLQRRLDQLPTEMVALYAHILGQIDPVYRQCSARSLLIAHESPVPLPFMLYWFLYEESNDSDFQSKIAVEPLTREQIRGRRSKVVNNLSSWCKGLLEVTRAARDESWNTWDPFREQLVDFHHRTAKDFMHTPDMQAFVTDSAGSDFNAKLFLSSLFLAMAKVANVQNGLADEMESFHWMAQKARDYARHYDDVAPPGRKRQLEMVSKQLSAVESQMRTSQSVESRSSNLQVAQAGTRRQSVSADGVKRLLRKLWH